MSSSNEQSRKRKESPAFSDQPTGNQPARNVKQKTEGPAPSQHGSNPRSQAPEEVPEAGKSQPSEEEGSNSGVSSKAVSIVLHHNVYPPWTHLPFAEPQQIELKIAINAHERAFDIVHYLPQSVTASKIAPWRLRTRVELSFPHKAVIVTAKEAVNQQQIHVMLFGEDMEDALKHPQRYAAGEVLDHPTWTAWYESLKRLWNGSDRGVVLIKNVFDKIHQEFLIRNSQDLMTYQFRMVVEGVKLDFKKKSGLSMTEVQDIFAFRTQIAVVTTHARSVEVKEFETHLHREWMRQMGVPENHVKFVERPHGSAFCHGTGYLRNMLDRASDLPKAGSAFAKGYEFRAHIVLDIDYAYAGATTVVLNAKDGLCAARLISNSTSINNGCLDLEQLCGKMLDCDFSGYMGWTAAESRMTLNDALQCWVEHVFLAIKFFDGIHELILPLPPAIVAAAQGADYPFLASQLRLTPGHILPIVDQWLTRIIELVRRQLTLLATAEANRQLQNVGIVIYMTGSWIQAPFLVDACTMRLRNEGLGHIPVLRDNRNDWPLRAAAGALWMMTRDPRRNWSLHAN